MGREDRVDSLGVESVLSPLYPILGFFHHKKKRT